MLTCLEVLFLSDSSSYFHLCTCGWYLCIVLKRTVPTSTLHILSDILGFFLIFLWDVVFVVFIFAEGIYHEAFCMPSFFSWWRLLKFHLVGEILTFEQIVQSPKSLLMGNWLCSIIEMQFLLTHVGMWY